MEKKSLLKKGLFLLTILLPMIFFVFLFAHEKTAYHEDEFFSYALSNSYKRPFLYGSSHLKTDNYNVWMDGDEFKYYLRTNADTNFQYDSVWYNQSMDVTPPFYYVILHTICSAFPDQFSWWFAFAINLVVFVIAQIFVYRLTFRLSHSKLTAYIICLLWPFTVGATETFLYLRFYAMMTMFGVILTDLSVSMLDTARTPKRREYLFLALTALLGALTQHLFLIYAFFLTLFTAVFLALQKRFRKMFAYGLSVLFGTLLSFVVFPASYDHLFKAQNIFFNEIPDVKNQMEIMADLTCKDLFGFEISYTASQVFFILKVAAMFGLPLLLPLIYVFRKECKTLWNKIKEHFRQKRSESEIKLTSADCYAFITIIAASVISFRIICPMFSFLDLKYASKRYLFLLYPFFFLVPVCLLSLIPIYRSSKTQKIFRSVLALVLAGLVIFGHYHVQYEYILKNTDDEKKITELTENNNCVLVTGGTIFMPIYCRMLENADAVYATTVQNEEYRTAANAAEYEKLTAEGKPFVVLLDTTPLFDESFYEELEQNGKIASSEDDGVDSIVQHQIEQELKQYGYNWSEERIIAWFEETTGYTATKYTEEISHYNTIAAYSLEPTEIEQ